VCVTVKYKTVQEALLLDFQDAMARGDLQRMKVMVDILTPFKVVDVAALTNAEFAHVLMLLVLIM
jgi:hypothetical protein